MPTECKYCGERVSAVKILGAKLLTGSFPECPNCGADDDTLEIVAERPDRNS